MPPANETYFRKGFGLKSAVQGTLDAEYNGRLVDRLREQDYTLSAGDVTVRLAKEFGFCYGVERAVEYAYQTRAKFPDRRVFLVGEIIHNPHVNERLRGMGVDILLPVDGAFSFEGVSTEDVVILPAFGVTIRDFQTLRELGCVLVDTTCGSVLNVWKRVESYARDGFTSLIHGKYQHEETRATASQTQKYPGAHYLIVRDMGEAQIVFDFLQGRASAATILDRFAPHATSSGFDPDVHLRRIGVANQTTMLARESLDIAAEVGAAIERARGPEARAADFRSFDTICSATQDRQDAVHTLLEEPLDVMLVIGGFNSSNTISLAMLCAEHLPTYHIEDASGIDPDSGTVHHRLPQKEHVLRSDQGWMSAAGPVRVGLTAGASTPNNKIGETVARIFATRGIEIEA